MGLKAARLGLSEAIRALEGKGHARRAPGPKFSKIDIS
jgi:hypothetical protein